MNNAELREDIANSLTETNLNSWDVKNVQKIFNSRLANEILKTKLSSFSLPDKWIWSTESNGNFSEKSAYKILQNNSYLDIGECSNAKNLSSLWKQIWKLKVS